MRKAIFTFLICVMINPLVYARWDSWGSGRSYSAMPASNTYKYESTSNYKTNYYKCDFVALFSRQTFTDFKTVDAGKWSYKAPEAKTIEVTHGPNISMKADTEVRITNMKSMLPELKEIGSIPDDMLKSIDAKINNKEVQFDYTKSEAFAFKPPTKVIEYNATPRGSAADDLNNSYRVEFSKPVTVSYGFGSPVAKVSFIDIRYNEAAKHIEVIRTDMRDIKTMFGLGMTSMICKNGGYDLWQ